MSKELGTVLRAARRELQLTQVQIAKRLAVSRAAVGQWENGEDPSTDNLIKICRELGIEVQAALEGNLKHVAGFKGIDKKPDFLGRVDKDREPLPIERHPFTQEDYFVKSKLVPYYPTHAVDDGTYVLISESPMFFAPRHKNLPDNNDLYMIGIVDSNLRPEIPSMSMAYADAGRIPSVGDAVIVKLFEVRLPEITGIGVKVNPLQLAIIGFLHEFTPERIVVQQTSPLSYHFVNLPLIAAMHPILRVAQDAQD